MIARELRLRDAADFERVRRDGHSVSASLLVLIVLPNDLGRNRYGVAAGRRLGSAVLRNRAKRLVREVLRGMHPSLRQGYDVLVIVRNRFTTETCAGAVRAQLEQLCRRVKLTDSSQASGPNRLG
jgi:ribonuclease P protein component